MYDDVHEMCNDMHSERNATAVCKYDNDISYMSIGNVLVDDLDMELGDLESPSK